VRGKIRLKHDLHITRSLNIQGPGTERLTIGSVFPDDYFVWVEAGATATIASLTFEHSSICNNASGTLTLTKSVISGNDGTSNGGCSGFGNGGIFNGGTLILINSTVSGNTGNWGGGITNFGALTLINSTVSGNTAYTGGASSLSGG
jgi:hypothetical protein